MSEIPSEAAVIAWVKLMRSGQGLLRAVEADLKAASLPPLEWYDALLELQQQPDGWGLRPVALESRLLLAQHNVSRLIERLVKAGLARRHQCDRDGRGHYVLITEEGRTLLKSMWPTYRSAIQRHVGEHLTNAEACTLAALLGKLQPSTVLSSSLAPS